MVVVSALATHRWARVQALEALSKVPAEALLRAAASCPSVAEAAVLPTCNRVEFYVATPEPDTARAQLLDALSSTAPDADLRRLLRWRHGAEAQAHLLRVAAGLESMVVGEPQILGQVKEAHARALAAGTAGAELNLLFHRAVVAGKRVRRETDLARGAVSVGSAAVVLARREVGALRGKRVVLVGTGEMAGLVARSLRGQGCRVTVASRRTDRARVLAAKLDGEVAAHRDLPALAAQADVLLYATASAGPPRFLLDAPTLRGWLRDGARGSDQRPLLVLDVANPRNVAPGVGRMRGVRLRNLDSLRSLGETHLAGRRREAARAEAILAAELRAHAAKEAELRAHAVLGEVHARMQGLARAEAQRALRRLNGHGTDPRTAEVVEALAQGLVKRMLAAPTAALKDAARRGDEDALREAARLLGAGDDPTPAIAPARRVPEAEADAAR